jgi:Na+/phosphate symporter
VITVAAALSPAVTQLAPPLDALLTTKQEVRRRERKCRKNFVVRVKDIEHNIKTEGLELTLENIPAVHLDE